VLDEEPNRNTNHNRSKNKSVIKIRPDKWKHFFVGIAMGIVLQTFVWLLFSRQLIWGTVIAFILVITISYGFELYSKFTGKGHYEVNDAVAATIGGALGMGIILMIELNRSFY
jgi:VanZ family protein